MRSSPVAGEVVERFRPTSGRVTGLLVVLFVLAVVVLAALPGDQGVASYVVWGLLLVGVLAWGTMLRPGLWATDDDLVMRNVLTTITIPLAAIEQVAVRQVLAVRVGDRRYVSPAGGQSRWQLRADRPDNGPKTDRLPLEVPYGTFVEERIHHLAELARLQEGIELMSDEQLARAADVRRDWAYPEIAALVVTAVGFVLALITAL
jgi:hypothetical protein